MPRNRYYSGPPGDHYDGTRFFNPGVETVDKGFADVGRWRRTSKPRPWPQRVEVERVVPDRRVEDLRVTCIGHATVLIQAHGLNIVTDPVWSDRASPLRFFGPKRAAAPAVAFEDLPRIDTVLLSHNHYDHLDIATLRRIVERDGAPIVTPLGNDAIVRRAIPKATIVVGDWWQGDDLSDEVAVTIVPAQHWSARGLGDRRMALWCGFVVQAGPHSVYFAGDTGYGDGRIFREMRQRLGPVDVALLPIGAYAPRWFMGAFHTDPDDAVRAMLDLEARQAVGIHWGVFRMSDEGRDEPRAALAEALALRQLSPNRFVAAEPGFVWRLGSSQ